MCSERERWSFPAAAANLLSGTVPCIYVPPGNDSRKEQRISGVFTEAGEELVYLHADLVHQGCCMLYAEKTHWLYILDNSDLQK